MRDWIIIVLLYALVGYVVFWVIPSINNPVIICDEVVTYPDTSERQGGQVCEVFLREGDIRQYRQGITREDRI